MADRPFRTLLRHLQRLAGASASGVLTDGQLVERFVRARDEAAFEVLLWRHGPLVWGLCRRLLRREADAEDAFQATFLVLVRKAGSIGKRDSVASWLYKVAYRVALQARARAARQAARERSSPAEPVAGPAEDPVWRDLRPVLDEEVNRLPEKYRLPVLLCYLEGKTVDEAAEQLGWPRGTVGTRLARARERLRGRLVRRGVALSAAGGGLLGEDLIAAAPPALVTATLKAANLTVAGKTAAAAGVSASVAILVEGVLRTMLVNKLKNLVVVVLAFVVLATGASLVASRQVPQEPKKEAEKPAPAAKAENRLPALLKDRVEAAKMEVWGRNQEFLAGRGTLDILIGASRRLLVAEQELSANRAEEIAALERHFKLMKQVQEVNDERFRAGRIPMQDWKESEYYLLDAEIQLERAKAK
jgi:RNA polymerase sigma factor (sigma-70 family)